MEFLNALVEVIKWPPLVVGVAGSFGTIFTLFLILLPEEYAKRLHFEAWRESNGHWLLFALGFFLLLLVLSVAMAIAERRKRKAAAREEEGKRKREAAERYAWLEEAFGSLQLMERVYMGWCLVLKAPRIHLDDGDGYTVSLCGRKLLERVGSDTYEVPESVWVYMLNNDVRLTLLLLSNMRDDVMELFAVVVNQQNAARKRRQLPKARV